MHRKKRLTLHRSTPQHTDMPQRRTGLRASRHPTHPCNRRLPNHHDATICWSYWPKSSLAASNSRRNVETYKEVKMAPSSEQSERRMIARRAGPHAMPLGWSAQRCSRQRCEARLLSTIPSQLSRRRARRPGHRPRAAQAQCHADLTPRAIDCWCQAASRPRGAAEHREMMRAADAFRPSVMRILTCANGGIARSG